MVAIVTGNGLGLNTGSAALPAESGVLGDPRLGRGNERIYVNSTTGNLVVQAQDEVLSARGVDLIALRTYNSQGLLSDDNGDNWFAGVARRVHSLSGTIGSAGSTVTRRDLDGAETLFTWDAVKAAYLSTDGSGAYDTLTYQSSTSSWTFTDGDTRAVETYDASRGGRLVSATDPDGNSLTLAYDEASGLVSSVASSSGELTYYDYNPSRQLTQIRTAYKSTAAAVAADRTLTRVRYAYDAANRLTQVIVDLSPEDNSVADGRTYITRYTYDGTSRRVASIVDGDGTTVSFTYVDGKVDTITDGLGRITRMTYAPAASSSTATANLAELSTTDTQTTTTHTLDPGALTATGGVPPGVLVDGVLRTGIAGAAGESLVYRIEVPAGASTLQVQTDGGSGDADLYLSFGQPPTTDTFDYRSYDSGESNEAISVADPAAGTWYVTVHAYTAIEDVSLVAYLDSSAGGMVLQPGVAVTGVHAGASPQDNPGATDLFYRFDVPAGATDVRIETRGLFGDADIYVNDDAPADVNNDAFSFYSENGGSDELITIGSRSAATSWYIQIRPYTAIADVSLVAYYSLGSNNPPAVSAGADQYAAAGTAVALSATASDDGDSISSVSWTQIAGPAVTLAGEQTSNASFTAPAVGSTTVLRFRVTVTDNQGVIATDTVDVAVFPASQSYLVQAGDSWATIAQALYGVGSTAAANALSQALGNPALSAGTSLTDLPAQLSVTTTSTGTVAPYYVVQAGDTWTTITQRVYGTSHTAAVAALQAALGNTALAAGAHLSVPSTLSYSSGSGGGSATVVDALGLSTLLEYDARGQLIRLTAPPAQAGASAQVLSFAYNAAGDLVSSTDALGRSVVYGYDANGNQTLKRDAAGNTVTRTYGSRNELLTETVYSVPDPDGAGAGLPGGAATTRYAYDGANHLRFTLSPEGRVTQYTYNTLGQRSAATTYTNNLYTAGSNPTLAELSTWAGGLSAADRALAEQRDYAYDLRGQLVSLKEYATATVSGSTVTYATPSEQRYVYDAFGRLLQSIDATGNSTVFAYDGLGRITLARDAANASTVYAYDDAGNRSTVTLANGQYSISQYNAAGQLVTSTAYNPAGAGLGATRYFHDALDRLRMVEDPTGTRRWMFYDPAGRKTADVDALGQVTEYAYDGAGRLVQSIAYSNVLSAATLATLTDAGGNPVTTKTVADVRPTADAAKDRLTTRYYDSAGRLAGVQDSAGYLTETRYDGASRVLGTTAYANAGTVTRVDTSTGSTLATPPALVRPAANAAADRVTRNLYGNDGLLLAALDAEGYLVEWEYDAAGRKVAQTRYANATPAAERAAGTLAALRPARHAQDQRSISLYDGQGRLAAELDAEGYLTEYQYDLADRLTTTTRWRNTALRTVTVDGAGVVSHQAAAGLTPATLRPGAGGSEATTRSYTVLGLLDTETQANGLVTRNVYDSLGRLSTSTRAYGSTEARGSGIGYDAWGRVQTETDGRGGTLTHAYDNAGRRISTTDARSNTTVFYYDAAGRLVYSILKTSLGGEVRESRFNAFGEAETRIAYTNRLAVADTTPLTGGLVNTTLAGKVNALTNASLDGKNQLSFTRRGQIQQAIDALGARADYSWDAFGQLTQSLADIGDGRRLRTDLAYDRRGLQLSSTADPTALNVRTSTEYDAFGRVTARVDARGLRSTVAYLRNDGTVDSGRKVVITDPANAARTTVYDAFDRTLAQTDALGHTVRFVHDVANRRVTMTSAEGIVSVTESNRHGQLYKLTDGAGATTTYAYDANGNLLSASPTRWATSAARPTTRPTTS